MNLKYDSLLPQEISTFEGELIITTKAEAPIRCKMPILYEDIFESHPTIIHGSIIQKLDFGFEESNLIIGVDPGIRTGLSITYYGQEIERSFFSSIDELVSHIITILAGLRAKRKIVKIGNGNMKIAQHISSLLNLRYCSAFELEFVDERRTTLKIKNFNQRGKRDMLSARYISLREGYRHFILPLSITG